MAIYMKVLLGLLLVAGISAGISNSCIDCIGTVEGGGSGCNWDVGSYSCGRYQIKSAYWQDCGQPGSSWESCAVDDSCARGCIRAYMDRYKYRCANQLGKSTNSLTCYDYGRIHNGGPNGCSKDSTLSYVKAMQSKC